MVFARVSRREWRAVPRSAGPGGRGCSSFLPVSGCGCGYGKPGANTVTCGFPVTVGLVAAACRNFGRAFCVRGEWRWRPGMFRMCSAAREAASAAAASASSDDDAVTWEDVIDRIVWRQTAVKDSSSAVTGALSFRRRARAAAASLRRAVAALARTSWVAVSQAQASEMTSCVDAERSTGPEVRSPAPAMVALSSPKVVSDALHRVRYVSRTWS